MGFKCSYSCCFTGHRANKLKTSENDIREELVLAIRQAYMDGYVYYITGCAWGVDLAVYNGAKGGTKNTIDYAMRRGVRIVLIDFRDR